MQEATYRFGPFVVDRARYRVLRDDTVVELTPKLLDLLLYLVDRPGALVTKEELLDTLWPGANVTENALAQAMSELRDALGDDAGAPQYIKTVARRGYRLIAPVTRGAAPPDDLSAPVARGSDSNNQAIAVMEFANVAGDLDSAWLSAGIAETVTADLGGIGRFRVIDRGRVAEAVRHTDGSLHAVSAALGARLVVVGSFQRQAERLRITARILDVQSGDAVADAKVDGPMADIFALQDQVVAQFSKELGAIPALGPARARETPSLEAYRAYTEAWLHLETLDLAEIPKAIASFERAIQIDPHYALAFTGLASAQLAAYEATRSDARPARELLTSAIGRARRAVQLDDTLAEAHASLAFALASAWDPAAVESARRAVTLEPTNWRHFFRLGHTSWGDERLQAASQTLALYPDFAFAHFQAAMVHVARGELRGAEAVLRQGAAVQDRQVARGDRYPALGLHWLLGLVRLADDDVDEALREFAREESLAGSNRLYGREYQMNAVWARGACLLRRGQHTDSVSCFDRALELYPEHVPSHIGLALAFRALGFHDRAEITARRVPAILDELVRVRPIEAAIVESQWHAAGGAFDRTCAVLGSLLDTAPPGFAAWTVPIEPFLHELSGFRDFAAIRRRLADRAR